jgi:hypothetical protein
LYRVLRVGGNQMAARLPPVLSAGGKRAQSCKNMARRNHCRAHSHCGPRIVELSRERYIAGQDTFLEDRDCPLHGTLLLVHNFHYATEGFTPVITVAR